MSFKVIYMTGAPAAGKSSACRELLAMRNDLRVFEYGKEMAAHLLTSTEKRISVSQGDLRGGTSGFVAQEDIDRVDGLAFEFAAKWRTECHVIIDSHHVTKEGFGFRISPFTIEKIKQLGATEIWILFVTAEETIARISVRAEGRTLPSRFEADLHTFLQASLAASYGIVGGVPTFLFDASSQKEHLLKSLCSRLDYT